MKCQLPTCGGQSNSSGFCPAHARLQRREKPVMKCDRCGKPGSDVHGEAVLCEMCLCLILREWRIRFEEFGALQEAQG